MGNCAASGVCTVRGIRGDNGGSRARRTPLKKICLLPELQTLSGLRGSPLLYRGDHVPDSCCRGWHGGLWVGSGLFSTRNVLHLERRVGPETLLPRLRLWWQLRQRPWW